MFASIYLATDILNDIYGRKQARKAVWLGFSSVIVMVILLQCSLAFIPAQEDISQERLKQSLILYQELHLDPSLHISLVNI